MHHSSGVPLYATDEEKASCYEEPEPHVMFLKAPPPDAWRYKFPNPADSYSFNFSQMLYYSYTRKEPLAQQRNPKEPSTVAIIGAGIAGTLAARELARAGFHVTLYEATNRIGGRTNSTRTPKTPSHLEDSQLTTYEQGAMRIPFFNTTAAVKDGGGPWKGGPYRSNSAGTNSLAEFWAQTYGISTAAFPNPGRAPGAPVGGRPGTPGTNTGVYINNGNGVDLTQVYPGRSVRIPSKTFLYAWPANAADLAAWPDANARPYVKYYHRGKEMSGVVPPVKLNHAIPDDDNSIPPSLRGNPDDVAGWRAGVMALRTVYYKWVMFARNLAFALNDTPMVIDGKRVVKDTRPAWKQMLWNSQDFEKWWVNSVMPRYQNVSFLDVVTTGPILPVLVSAVYMAPNEWLDGNFGGLGMNAAEAQLFYTIGAGDGSWGAFFPNSALWALRALLFGYAQEHQLIVGVLNAQQTEVRENLDPKADTTPGGEQRGMLEDSDANKFMRPQYMGTNAYAESNFFRCFDPDGDQADPKNLSVYKLTKADNATSFLHTSTRVVKVENLSTSDAPTIGITAVGPKQTFTRKFNYVIITVPIWVTQTEMWLEGFNLANFPLAVPQALSQSHWIRSCKVFVTLKKPFWKGTGIPQMMSTNAGLQDIYGLVVPQGDDPDPQTGGIALISYTWEDDAQKFLSYQAKDLVVNLLAKLERVLANAGLPKFGQFMLDETLSLPQSYSVHRWSLEPFYHGCAKAYQPGIENLNYALMTYNKAFAGKNGLYFSGDAYSLESGWFEPAQRMAMDAALHIMRNDAPKTVLSTIGGTFSFDRDYKTAETLTTAQAQRTEPIGPRM